MTQEEKEIRIYVACLASYNNGVLHGCWIDACQDTDAIWEEIAAMLKASPTPGAEEYAIHDYEGFEGAPMDEFTGYGEFHALAKFIREHGALGGKLVAYYFDLEHAKTAIEENYCGQFCSLAAFAEEWTQELWLIPENLRSYIDYESMARDLVADSMFAIETAPDVVHMFWQL